MPKYPTTPENCIEAYLNELIHAGRSQKTTDSYRWTLLQATRNLQELGLEFMPWKVGRYEIERLLNGPYARLAISTRAWTTAIIGAYMEHYGNPTVKKMRIIWPHDMRIRADWLTHRQAALLRDFPLPPFLRAVIHLELSLGLRRVELIRLKTTDLSNGYLNVHGKGRGGGKWRTVPYHRNTWQVMENLLEARQKMVRDCLQQCPEQDVPDNLFLWVSWACRLNSYAEKGTGFDKAFIHPVRETTGIAFSNHTLRRTFGRNAYQAGVRLETISKIMGHEDTKTTIRYLGLNMDDMTAAMETISTYDGRILE